MSRPVWTARSGIIGPAALAGFVGLVIGLGGCRLDREFIYHPDRPIPATPEAAGLPYEDVYYKTADGIRLNGWFVPAPGSTEILIWFHGNAGNIGHRVENIRRMHDALGVSIFIFDYREYGRSEGSVSEAGTYEDARASLEFLKSRTGLSSDRILYFGRSLGSAVAVELALESPPRALILESPMTSIRDMARVVLPYLPTGFLIQTEYDSISKIGKIHRPVFILHGDRDDVVPFEQGRRLFGAANEPKFFYAIPGASHNDTYLVGGKLYWEAWKKFLNGLPR